MSSCDPIFPSLLSFLSSTELLSRHSLLDYNLFAFTRHFAISRFTLHAYTLFHPLHQLNFVLSIHALLSFVTYATILLLCTDLLQSCRQDSLPPQFLPNVPVRPKSLLPINGSLIVLQMPLPRFRHIILGSRLRRV